MKFLTFDGGDGPEIGLLDGEDVVAINRADAGLPHDMTAFIAGGAGAMDAAKKAATDGPRLKLSAVRMLAPVPVPPRNIFCVGKNYREHAKEVQSMGLDTSGKPLDSIPEHPIFFTKALNTISASGDAICTALDPTNSVDYEGELTVVIGRGGRGITRANALDHVFGYTIVNDVSARKLQKRHNQWFLGKNVDGFCPMGPVLVTVDEIPDVTALKIITRVNGEVRQDGALADLIFDIPCLIETLSSIMTLLPGDVIATGTPAGVGMGFNPPKFLKAGDVVSIEVPGIGILENPVT